MNSVTCASCWDLYTRIVNIFLVKGSKVSILIAKIFTGMRHIYSTHFYHFNTSRINKVTYFVSISHQCHLVWSCISFTSISVENDLSELVLRLILCLLRSRLKKRAFNMLIFANMKQYVTQRLT
jgi:hypothetical protein